MGVVRINFGLNNTTKSFIMTNIEKFDVFIAYYGNRITGSEKEARELYDYLIKMEIFPGRSIRPYFHPVTNPYGRFEDTPLIVARTPMFLFVVDKSIKRTDDGQIICYREDGTLSNIYEEVRTFHDSVYKKNFGGDQAGKLFITDDFNVKDAERLHPVFSGRTALMSKDEVADWIAYFYRNTYLEIIYKNCKYLAENRQEEFEKGYWINEAKTFWDYTHDERIARILMIYCITVLEKDSENKEYKNYLKVLYDHYKLNRNLASNTQKLLEVVRFKYIGENQ